MKSANKFKEKMPPSKKLVKKGGKMVAGKDYSEKPDISTALRKSKEGYSKKPRVKPDRMKAKGK
jgi:hypothetical protein